MELSVADGLTTEQRDFMLKLLNDNKKFLHGNSNI